jgi:hypothetical protein
MEGTLRDYMHLKPEAAIEYAKKLINEVKAVNGTFISIWHNESLSNQMRWKDWREVYINIIEYALNNSQL